MNFEWKKNLSIDRKQAYKEAKAEDNAALAADTDRHKPFDYLENQAKDAAILKQNRLDHLARKELAAKALAAKE